MQDITREKLKGLRVSLTQFSKKLSDFNLSKNNTEEFTNLIIKEMNAFGFDKALRDRAGNSIGLVKGYIRKKTFVVISHMDVPDQGSQAQSHLFGSTMVKFKSGIINGIFSAALLKRALIPLGADLIFCCVPRIGSSDYSVRYLFRNFLKHRIKNIQGVILCEPTNGNVNLGHKGKMEYEIVVRGKLDNAFLEHRGINILGAMFPLIHELENVSRALPADYTLGASALRIKDVRYGGYESLSNANEFRIIVDRVFIPEESEQSILAKAKNIARNIYKGESEVNITTALAKERIKTPTGLEIVSEKESKPWIMEERHPLVANSLQVLKECALPASVGYWKNIFTEGSYTHGVLGIPTIGFGLGEETGLMPGCEPTKIEHIEKAIYGLTMMIARNIGIPSFGWNSDEI